MRDRLPLFLGLTLLALAIALGSYEIADGIRNRSKSETITVTGSAKQRITSDYAIWDVTVTSQQPTAAAAAGQLATWSARTRAFLLANGAKPDELTVQPISTSTLTSNTGAVTGFQLTRIFELRSTDVDRVAGIAEKSSQLIAAGIPHARFERFENCGHGVWRDQPDQAFRMIRRFILD